MRLRMAQDINLNSKTPLFANPNEGSDLMSVIFRKKNVVSVEKEKSTLPNTTETVPDRSFQRRETAPCHFTKQSSHSPQADRAAGFSCKTLIPSVVKVHRASEPVSARRSKAALIAKKKKTSPTEVSEAHSEALTCQENVQVPASLSTENNKPKHWRGQAAPLFAPAEFKSSTGVDARHVEVCDCRDALARGVKKPVTRVRSVSAPRIFLEKNSNPTAPERAERLVGGTVFYPSSSTLSKDEITESEELEEMEAVLEYIQHITEALAGRRRGLPPSAHLNTFRATITPQSRLKTSTEGEAQNKSVLLSLQEAATLFLSWFSKLEYLNLSQHDSLRNLELQTLESGARVLGLLESVERNFSTHEMSGVREVFFTRPGCWIVMECRELIDAMAQTAQHIALLRKLVHKRDLSNVRDLLKKHTCMIKQRMESTSSKRSKQYQEEMLRGPFFAWLEHRWLPAMCSWQRVVFEARQLAISGNVQLALAHSQKETFGVSALHDILIPGETLEDLHRAEIADPILELGRTMEKKKEAMHALLGLVQKSNSVISTVTQESGVWAAYLAELQAAIQVCRETPNLDNCAAPINAEMKQVVTEAEKLLLDLQAVEKIRRAFAENGSTNRPDSAVRLFLGVHMANQLICRLHLVEAVTEARHIVSRCQIVADKLGGIDASSDKDDDEKPYLVPPTSLVDLLPSDITIPDLCLVHMTSSVWPSSMRELYKRACLRLAELFTDEQLDREIAQGAPKAITASPPCGSKFMDAAFYRSPSKASTHDKDYTLPDCTIRKSELGRGSDPSDRSDIVSSQVGLCLREETGTGASPPVRDHTSPALSLYTLKLKVHFEGQTRIVHVHEVDTTSFEHVSKRLYKQCCELFVIMHRSQSSLPPNPQRLRIRYEDSDGDFITLLNDEDWRVMLSELRLSSTVCAGEGNGIPAPSATVPKLEVYCDFILLPEPPSKDPEVLGGMRVECMPEARSKVTDTLDPNDGVTELMDGSASCSPPVLGRKVEKKAQDSPAMMRLDSLMRRVSLNSAGKNNLAKRSDRGYGTNARSRSAQRIPTKQLKRQELGQRTASPSIRAECQDISSVNLCRRGLNRTIRTPTPNRSRSVSAKKLFKSNASTTPQQGNKSPKTGSGKLEVSVQTEPGALVHPSCTDLNGLTLPERTDIALRTNKRWDQEGEDESVLEMQTIVSMLTSVTNQTPEVVFPRGGTGPESTQVRQPETAKLLPLRKPPVVPNEPDRDEVFSAPAYNLTKWQGSDGCRVAPGTRPPLPNSNLSHVSPMSRYNQCPLETANVDDENEYSSPSLNDISASRHRKPEEVLQEMYAMREENQRAMYGRRFMRHYERT